MSLQSITLHGAELAKQHGSRSFHSLWYPSLDCSSLFFNRALWGFFQMLQFDFTMLLARLGIKLNPAGKVATGKEWKNQRLSNKMILCHWLAECRRIKVWYSIRGIRKPKKVTSNIVNSCYYESQRCGFLETQNWKKKMLLHMYCF